MEWQCNIEGILPPILYDGLWRQGFFGSGVQLGMIPPIRVTHDFLCLYKSKMTPKAKTTRRAKQKNKLNKLIPIQIKIK